MSISSNPKVRLKWISSLARISEWRDPLEDSWGHQPSWLLSLCAFIWTYFLWLRLAGADLQETMLDVTRIVFHFFLYLFFLRLWSPNLFSLPRSSFNGWSLDTQSKCHALICFTWSLLSLSSSFCYHDIWYPFSQRGPPRLDKHLPPKFFLH